MDHAVSLVQAYLQLNGYFTAAEYPIMQRSGRNGFRTLTDIDVLAFRFPTPPMNGHGDGIKKSHHLTIADPDPGLQIAGNKIDLIIGEVKEGRVAVNDTAIDPSVLKAIMGRFGCPCDDPMDVSEGLRKRGEIEVGDYLVRVVAFGAMPPADEIPPCRIISLKHVLQFLQSYVRRNWGMLRHCQVKDPVLGFLSTMEKARRGEAGRRGDQGVEVVTGEERAARVTR